MLQNGKVCRWIQEKKTKKCNSFKKILFSFIAAGISAAFSLYAADSSKWTLAAEQFSFTQKNMTAASYVAVSKALPQLMMEQFAQNLTRSPRAQEQLDRKLYDFRKTRLDLFLQLSKEVQTRDALVLKDYSQSVLNSKIKASDKKIAEIEAKIKENLTQTEKVYKEFEPKIEMEQLRKERIEKGEILDEKQKGKMTEFLMGFIPGNKEEVVFEDVCLYQNDYMSLFSAGNDKKSQGYDSYAFEKACVDAGINALITGKITRYSTYLSVQVSMYQFPGAKIIANAVEVGSVDDLKSIAVSLANQITPKIADSMPVDLFFEIGPEQARENTIITIDDVVYRGIPEKMIVQSGVHTVQVSSQGFISLNTVYSFKGARTFNISVELKEDTPGTAMLYLKNPIEGSIFTNGVLASQTGELQRGSEISINNQNILGHFVGENGHSSDFFIKSRYLTDGANLVVKANPFDRSKYIDKRRRWMYTGYSALIVSLIPTFYVYGNYNSISSAYNSSAYTIDYNKAVGWQTANYITTGISIGCGVFFVYELVRYLMAANTVLPSEAKLLTQKEEEKILFEQEKALQKKLLEETKLKEAAELQEDNQNNTENLLETETEEE